MNNRSAGLVLLLLFAGLCPARPVMVAVRLDAIERVRAWRDLGVPTYAFVSGLAIAELDDQSIPALARKGFDCEAWDDRPWSSDYYYFRIPNGSIPARLEGVAYQGHGVGIVKTPKRWGPDALGPELRAVRLEREPLSSRFWDRASRRIVGLRGLPWDPFIQGLVDLVSADSIRSNIQRLQDFKTRLFLLDSCYACEEWLRQRFTGWGYAAGFDSFYLSLSWPRSGWDRNVLASKAGNMLPGRSVIVCGHHDCIVWPDSATARTNAPGADDNATGCAGAMEIARIFRDQSWEPTFVFAGWAAEEMGLYGSRHYSAWADSHDLDIQAVINLDMIGFMNDAAVDCNAQSHGSFTAWLSSLMKLCGQVYAPTLALYEEVWSGGSDDLPFYQHGYASTCVIERWYNQNPNYHKVTDLIATTSESLYVAVTRASLACAAVLGTYPGMVQNPAVCDLGDGQRLYVKWSANPETDIAGYRVYWGLQSGSYPDSVETQGLNDTLTGLLKDSLYYVVVRAIDADGHPSPMACEVAGRPVRWVKLADVQTPLPSFWARPNHPNPFVNDTRFEYYLPVVSWVTIKIYNDAGQLLSTLVDQLQAAGSHSVIWGGNDEEGRSVSNGVYFYSFNLGQEHISGQLLLLK